MSVIVGKFESSDMTSSTDAPKSVRPLKLDDKLLETILESDPCQNIEDFQKTCRSMVYSSRTHKKKYFFPVNQYIYKSNRCSIFVVKTFIMEYNGLFECCLK